MASYPISSGSAIRTACSLYFPSTLLRRIRSPLYLLPLQNHHLTTQAPSNHNPYPLLGQVAGDEAYKIPAYEHGMLRKLVEEFNRSWFAKVADVSILACRCCGITNSKSGEQEKCWKVRNVRDKLR